MKDVNDNPPVFLDSPYVAWVMEGRGRGHPGHPGHPKASQVVARVSAHDADSPPHNSLSYRLKEGDKSVFAVNDSTGDVYLLRSLDRETQSSYTLVIAAVDSGESFQFFFNFFYLGLAPRRGSWRCEAVVRRL